MFPDTEVSLLLIPAIAVFAIIVIFANVKFSREGHPGKKLAMRIHFAVLMGGGFFLYLWFLLPGSTLPPRDVADVESPQKILHYLQSYNGAIVRTAEILHWGIFLGVCVVGAGLESALREFRATTFQESQG
jgi:hypothetical protein